MPVFTNSADRSEQTSQHTPGEEQDAPLGHVEQSGRPSRSLQTSRARMTPKMSLELKRKEDRRARMSSSRALDTSTSSQQPDQTPEAPQGVRKTARLFMTEDSPLKVPTTHPASSRRGGAHAVCPIIRPFISPLQPSGRALHYSSDQLETGSQLD